jgi:hypothetical protein
MFLNFLQGALAQAVPFFAHRWLFLTCILVALVMAVIGYLRSYGYQKTLLTPKSNGDIASWVAWVADFRSAVMLVRGLVGFVVNFATTFGFLFGVIFIVNEFWTLIAG